MVPSKYGAIVYAVIHKSITSLINNSCIIEA